MIPDRPLRRVSVVVAMLLVAAVGVGCGNDDADDDRPDEASFCRLAAANRPVAEARATVLQGLDRLAPAEIDPAVVVLREAAEELEELTRGTPEHIAAEFEIRFRADYIVARNEVEAFIEAECADDLPGRSIGSDDTSDADRKNGDTKEPDTKDTEDADTGDGDSDRGDADRGTIATGP